MGAEEPWQLHLTSHHSAKRKDPFFPIQQKPQDGLPLARPGHTGVSEPRAGLAPPKQQGLRQVREEQSGAHQGLSTRQGGAGSIQVLTPREDQVARRREAVTVSAAAPKGALD